jgi:teichuronic acid biosynthesis glycosyltransferase TuaC
MNILLVCSYNKNKISAFIFEQTKALGALGMDIEFFGIEGKGSIGYLKNYSKLRKKINQYVPDLIHAHYGLSGLLANLQRRIPVVTTFHGSDINTSRALKYSKMAFRLSAASIFVNQSMAYKICKKLDGTVIPCAVDDSNIIPLSKSEARQELGFSLSGILILFSSSFDNHVKNYPLSKASCEILEDRINRSVTLIELKDFTRQEVNFLLNASDCALLTSFSEGSPQFIKEAMACNCPVVSTDVGDVAWLFGNEPGHYLTSFDPDDVAEKLKMALEYAEEHGRTRGRERILELGLDSKTIASRIINVYESVLKKNAK